MGQIGRIKLIVATRARVKTYWFLLSNLSLN